MTEPNYISPHFQKVHYASSSIRDFRAAEGLNGGQVGEPVELVNVTKTEYQYKYNGFEYQDELGLGWYDYGARNYDPAFVRTLTMDPLAEQYYSASPYSLFNNNPLRYADPTGMKGEDWIKQIGTNGQQTFTYDATVKTVQDAQDKGYENVESVGEYKISGNGYSYDLNSDGSVVYNSPINTSTYVDRKDDFTTPGGRIIKGFCNGCTYSQSYLSSTSNSCFLGDPSRRIAMGMLQGGAAELTGYGMGQALRPISKLVTTSDGFLFGGINTKAPFNISTQRFGNMNAVGGADYWALKIGSDEVLNRSLNAIKTEWNPLTQYTTGIIPKGTPIKVGIVGSQGGFYGGIYSGGGVQFRVNSNSVINQSTKIVP